MPNDAPSSSLPTFEVGQKLAGVYVLRKQISADAGSQVWLAQDEVLGKDVSLHFVPPIVRADERAMGELRQEIKRNRQLIHPGILRVYDLVEEPEWSAISMDWFEGESLAALQKAKPGGFFEPSDVKPWLQQVCHTLDDIHKIQIVHRDVAPHNIFVDTKGKVLIARFGISRVLEDALSRLRKDGGKSSHLASLSPQCLDGEQPSKADDIYSIGATIYQLLTGELPFVGDGLLAQIRKNPPQSMMERRSKLFKRGGTILPVWEKWVAAALAKGTAERPASAGELATKLGLTGKLGADTAATIRIAEPRPEPAAAAAKTKAAQASTIAAIAAATSSTKAAPAPEEAAPEIKLPTPRTTAPPPVEAAIAEPPAAKTADADEEDENEDEVAEAGARETSHAPVKRDEPALAGAKRPGMSNGLFYGGLIALVAVLAYLLNRPDEAEKKKEAAAGPIVNATPIVEATPVKPKVVKTSPAPVSSPVVAKASPTTSATPGIATTTPIPVKASPGVALNQPGSTAPDHVVLPGSTGDDDKDYLNALKQKQLAETAYSEAESAVKKKAEGLIPLVKDGEKLQAQRTERAEKLKAAEDEAAAARQAAEAKAKALEESKKAQAEWDAANGPKLASLDKANTEFRALQTALEEKKQQSAAAAKALADADTARQQRLAARKVADEKAAAEKHKQEEDARLAMLAQKKAEEDARRAEAKAAEEAIRAKADRDAKINDQIAAVKKQLEDLIKMQQGDATATTPPVATPIPRTPATPGPRGAATPHAPTPIPRVMASPAPSTPLAVSTTPPPPPPGPQPIRQTDPQLLDQTQLAMIPTVPVKIIPSAPPATPAPATATPAPAATVAQGESSLGLKFAPVGDVLFCLWPTRYKDFDLFVKESGYRASSWRSPGFKQGPEHPVVNVSWNDAIAFCKWLTDRDRKQGSLKANESYRLPTDLEWSRAVGLPEENGKTPEARDMGVSDVFPWGTQWPPPPNVGNYTGEETGSDVAIKGYEDGYAWTSPVGTFPPNKFGLYDVGGNVWQWCMDNWSAESKAKVLRGASWYNGALKLSLLSSCRVHANPDSSTDNYGFRIVKVAEAAKKK